MNETEKQRIRQYLEEIDPAPKEDFAQSEPASPKYSDDQLALAFAERHKENTRYVNPWAQWLHYRDGRWVKDADRKFFDMARAICREASEQYLLTEPKPSESVSKQLASAKTVAAVLAMASSDRRLAATADQWDSNLWLLNTPAGAIDLRTGELRPHRREDFCTKMTAVSPSGDCPLWLKFLERITDGNRDLQRFLQRIAGYSVTGSTNEHSLFFLFGTGANGKTVYLNTLAGILGDYARTAPIETFIASQSEHHPTDLAGLMGARLVTAVETEDGRRWAESKIKNLTGGDRIAARFMRQDFFEFTPQFKLVIAGNHRPGLRTVDEAIRRRFHFLPFTVTIPPGERDHQLSEKLREEWPGILQWMIDGCVQWQQQGLNPPDVVRTATEDYMANEDTLGQWIAENTTYGDFCMLKVLHADYQKWCEAMGERYMLTQSKLGQKLEDRGYERARTMKARGFSGIVPRSEMPL
jgi:putative DNA primase/helicase